MHTRQRWLYDTFGARSACKLYDFLVSILLCTSLATSVCCAAVALTLPHPEAMEARDLFELLQDQTRRANILKAQGDDFVSAGALRDAWQAFSLALQAVSAAHNQRLPSADLWVGASRLQLLVQSELSAFSPVSALPFVECFYSQGRVLFEQAWPRVWIATVNGTSGFVIQWLDLVKWS
eukprot:2257918-Pleurochrysis_carterae.AAC.2